MLTLLQIISITNLIIGRLGNFKTLYKLHKLVDKECTGYQSVPIILIGTDSNIHRLFDVGIKYKCTIELVLESIRDLEHTNQSRKTIASYSTSFNDLLSITGNQIPVAVTSVVRVSCPVCFPADGPQPITAASTSQHFTLINIIPAGLCLKQYTSTKFQCFQLNSFLCHVNDISL